MAEILHRLDAPARERVAALRAQGECFWLDVSLAQMSRDDVIEALEPPGNALRALPAGGDARAARAFYADGASIAFALHCYVDCDAPTDQGSSHLRPLQGRRHGGTAAVAPRGARVAPGGPRGPADGTRQGIRRLLGPGRDAREHLRRTGRGRVDARRARRDVDGRRRHTRAEATLREAAARLSTMRRWVTAEQAVPERVSGARPRSAARRPRRRDEVDAHAVRPERPPGLCCLHIRRG